MNIFVVDNDPKVAATMLCDKHVVKMIIETAQMLCTVAASLGHQNVPYRPTHTKHPCTLWAGESKDNWGWLVTHGLEMCAEYTRRYGRRHKTQDVIEWCRDSGAGPKSGSLTPFRLAMPQQYKCNDPVKSYRDYYIGEKSRIAKWKTSPPAWWPQ